MQPDANNMLGPVPFHETLAVLDSTKLQSYARCPRRFFYEYVLGWKPVKESIHLVFGNAWHLALEVLLRDGFGKDAQEEAFGAFLEHYRAFFSPTEDDLFKPKTPENARRAIPQYCKRFASDLDEFKVLKLETPGAVSIGAGRNIHFKADALCQGEEGFFFLEHKTSTRFSITWAAQWRQKLQVGTYTHALFCLFPPAEVYGVKINGAFFSEAPKLRRDGEPYAGAKDNEFARIPVRRNLASMQSWLDETHHTMNQLDEDLELLTGVSENDSSLGCFHRNTESCTDFGGCPFLDYCAVWHNPAQHQGNPPHGFEVRHWDPRRVVSTEASPPLEIALPTQQENN